MKKIWLKNINTNEFELVEVVKYYNFGRYYELIFEDGTGYIPSERVKEIK